MTTLIGQIRIVVAGLNLNNSLPTERVAFEEAIGPESDGAWLRIPQA
jgi:hypothetical protein